MRGIERGIDDIESEIWGKFDILSKRFLGKKEDVLSVEKPLPIGKNCAMSSSG